MARHHPLNERIKRQYLAYLKEVDGKAESTIDQAMAAIALFEESTGHRDFKKFHVEQARKFKRWLQDHVNPDTGKGFSLATIHGRQKALKAFFKWLACQPGYKSRIAYSDAEYFNTAGNDERVAKAEQPRAVPSLEQIEHALDALPTATVLARRDRAVFAFTLLSGARDDAIASMSLRHVDLDKRTVFHDARAVRTKRRKSFVSTFFPVGDDFECVVTAWISELQSDHLFGPDDPLFPATEIGLNAEGHFAPMGLSRRHWSNAATIRKIFRTAFESAGLPYFNPHSFRNTLTMLGQRICGGDIEAFKVWSQNLGHEKVLTTLTSYGVVSSERQAEVMENLRKRQLQPHAPAGAPDAATVSRVLDYLRQQTP
jgi:integrase